MKSDIEIALDNLRDMVEIIKESRPLPPLDPETDALYDKIISDKQ